LFCACPPGEFESGPNVIFFTPLKSREADFAYEKS